MVFSERFDIYSILLFISIGQMMANVMFLLFKKSSKKNKSTWLFIFALLVLSFNILEPVLIRTRLLFSVPHLLYIGPSFLLLLGPLVYLQMLALKSQRFLWKTLYLLHALPFLLIKIKSLPSYLKSGLEKKELLHQYYIMENSDEFLIGTENLLGLAIQLHPVAYIFIALVITIKNLRIHESRLTASHAIYLFSFLITFIFYLFGRYILDLIGLYSPYLYGVITSIFIYSFVCLVSYMILSVRLEPRIVKKKLNLGAQGTDSYNKLKEYINEHRPYLSSEISLNSLAQMLGFTPHYLSRLIKEYEGSSFLEFINHHRIETVKGLIINSEFKHYTIEAIGQEAGFSNKMSLSRAFKKHCGMTPSEFKNKALQQSNG